MGIGLLALAHHLRRKQLKRPTNFLKEVRLYKILNFNQIN